MTKSDHIRSLNNGIRTTRDIADIVGCGTSYVRVVLRQRGTDRDPRRYGDRYAANKAARKAYAMALACGLDADDAARICRNVRTSTIDKTGRAALRAAA